MESTNTLISNMLVNPNPLITIASLVAFALILYLVETYRTNKEYNKKKAENELDPARDDDVEKLDNFLRWKMLYVTLALLGVYGVVACSGYVPIPLARELAVLKTNIILLKQTIGAGAQESDAILNMINATVHHAAKLRECTDDLCREEAKEQLRPFLEYTVNKAKIIYEKAPESNGTQEIYEGAVKLRDGLMKFNYSDPANANVTDKVHKLIVDMAFHSLPDYDKSGYNLESLTLEDAQKLLHHATKVSNLWREAAKQSRDVFNNVQNIAMIIGANKLIDSWRQNLEDWGLPRGFSILIISSFGPDVSAMITFIACFVKDYVESGETFFVFLVKFWLGGSWPYMPHLFKMLAYHILTSYFCLAEGLISIPLYHLRSLYRQTGQFRSKKYILVTCIILAIRSFRVISSMLIWVLLCGLIPSVLFSYIANQFRWTITTWIFTPYWELQTKWRIVSRQYSTHFDLIGIQGGIIGFYVLCHSIYKFLQYNTERNPNFSYERRFDGYSPKRPLYNRFVKLYKIWTWFSRILCAISWGFPIVCAFINLIAPEWAANWPMIGHLDLLQGGANYFWSAGDVVTVPSYLFKRKAM